MGKKIERLYGELREEIVTKTCLHDPLDYANTLKLRFRVAGLILPERRKKGYTSYTSSMVEEEGAQSCPYGDAGESSGRM